MPALSDIPEIEQLLLDRPDPSAVGGTAEWGIVWEAEGRPRPVVYEPVAGLAVTEGDLRLGRISDAIEYRPSEGAPALVFGATLTAGVLVPSGGELWLAGRIPFDCDEALRPKVEKAKGRWNAKVGDFLRLEEKTPADTDFLDFVTASLKLGNTSDVGKQGGPQQVTIVPKSAVFKIVHEIGHAAGLYHEHNRSDRKNYIEILWNNIAVGKDKHFKPYLSNGKDHGDYDFDSVMHYRPLNDFGKPGLPTFEVTPAGTAHSIALTGGPPKFKPWTLSPGDAAALRDLYGA